MYIRDDTKAEILWTFKGGMLRKGHAEYAYNKIVFKISGSNLVATFYPSFKCGRKVVATLKNFRKKTALQALKYHCGPNGWGRHFEDGIKQVYHDLGLPLGYNVSCLKDFEPEE